MTCDHVMLDLETVDTVATAGIVSIGAFVFYGPSAGKKLYVPVQYQDCLRAGMSSSVATMDWWGGQPEEVKKALYDPGALPLSTALEVFTQFARQLCAPRMWGNGADFDNAILQYGYRLCRWAPPWKFYHNRCYRTVSVLAPLAREQQGVYHNALDDAVSQASHLLRLMRFPQLKGVLDNDI